MKKINIFIDDVTGSGGTERVTAFLANGLINAGHDVTIYSLMGKEDSPYYKLDVHVNVIIVNSTSVLALYKTISSNACDVTISISMGRLSFKLSLAHFLSRSKSKLILSEHVAYEISPYWVRLLKLLSYNLADELVVLTDHDYLLIKNKVRSRVSIIKNASNFIPLDKNELSVKKKIVLAVGRLTYQKSFDRLLQIWSEIEDLDGWTLRILGDGEEFDNLKMLASRLGIASSVSILPASKSIDAEYRDASILAMTSRYEGLPLVLIESKCFGLPAICYDCKTGPKELISNNNDGYLIENNNSDAFGKHLYTLMSNDALRMKMQLNALSSSGIYSEENIMEHWFRVI